jgi:hypothetical protein
MRRAKPDVRSPVKRVAVTMVVITLSACSGGQQGRRADGGRDSVPDGGPDARFSCTHTGCSDSSAPVCNTTTGACVQCLQTADCKGAASPICNTTTNTCVQCLQTTDCAAATSPICDTTANACRGCSTGPECAAISPSTPACASTGACVACVGNGDCTTATKPICDTTANTCRPCASDAECPANPGVCMADGHCAAAGEVIFVQFNSAGCPSPDGSAAKPYCAPNDAVTALTSTRHIIVIVGAAGDRMKLNTTGLSPVVIGRKDSGGNVGSIPAGPATAVAVSSDTVLIRDLTVNAGTTSTSTGILVTGSSTNVTLIRVMAALGTGLGVDAESGATLAMNGCSVSGNGAGGILLNGAAFDIENTTVVKNGPGTFGPTNWGGVFVNGPPGSGAAKLALISVQNNTPVGISCSSNISTKISGVLASDNGVDVNSTCGFSSCGRPSTTCGAQ